MTYRGLGPLVDPAHVGGCTYAERIDGDTAQPCGRPSLRHVLVITFTHDPATFHACAEHLRVARAVAGMHPGGAAYEHPVGPGCLTAWSIWYPTHCNPDPTTEATP